MTMNPTILWLIVLGIGVVLGFIVHSTIRYAQGASVLLPILAGIVGAFVGALYIAPYFATQSMLVSRFVGAAIGAFVLSFIVELLFIGSTRGHVVTT